MISGKEVKKDSYLIFKNENNEEKKMGLPTR